MTFNIQDMWYTWILRRHRHDYKRMEDEKTYGISWQRHQCVTCTKIVGLDEWQIRRLPTDMLYERIDM